MSKSGNGAGAPANKLYFGDNLDMLQEVSDGTVDLVYLDPPFNSQAQYNILFKSPKEDTESAQAQAFRDTWFWGDEAERCFAEVMRIGGETARFIDALRGALRESDMMAYLVMMAARLYELRQKLKPDGSLYLHCDPNASHYLKVVLDGLFGSDNFRNEVIWRRTRAHNDKKIRRFGSIHDSILFYSKTDNWNFNVQYMQRDENAPKTHDLYMHTDGKLYRKGDCRAPGNRGPLYDWNGYRMHWRFSPEERDRLIADGRIVYSKNGMPRVLRPIDPEKGSPLQDIWFDIDALNPGSNEITGYPTQKPLDLLERIILSSSKEGDLVLDPFCGCGTAIEAAEKNHRHWIGIDIAVHAIKVIEGRLGRLTKNLGATVKYDIEGMPRDFESALKLAERDKYQFQWWANYLFNPHALRQNLKKGADRGIDGELFFPNGPGRPWGRMLTSVKGGEQVGPAMVRDFARVLERENAQMGLFICLHEPTKEMKREAASVGRADIVHGDIPKLQIVAIEDWFKGKMPLLPPLEHLPSAAFSGRRRPAIPKPDAEQPELPFTFIGGKVDHGIIRHFNPGMVNEAAA